MPWNEMGGLHKETSAITQQLAQLNRAGYLTINSQPLVNAAPSDDLKVGWGGPGGYVKLLHNCVVLCGCHEWQSYTSGCASDRASLTLSHYLTIDDVCMLVPRYVYQKAYVEFFVSAEKFGELKARTADFPSLTYMGVNSQGDFHSNQA